MGDELDRLSYTAAVAVLSDVASRWLHERTAEATGALLSAAVKEGTSFSSLPKWALDPRESEEEAGRLARSALVTISEGNDDEAVLWVVAARRKESESVAHLIDPVSLGILGGILIGCILAARIKKVGKVEFYEGVPKELADVLKAGTGMLGSPPSAN